MTELRNPTVWNPKNGIIYVDDPYSAEPTYKTPLMNAREFMSQIGGGSKAASTQSNEQVFYDNDKPQHNYLDISNQYYDKIVSARNATRYDDRVSKAAAVLEDPEFQDFQNTLTLAQAYERPYSKAGAIITSKDFTDFQTNNVIFGENPETAIRTGVLVGLFQTIALPSLSGKWQSFSNDLKYHRNIPEGKSPEPSKGTGATTTVSVQKHGGAVAWTQRAEAVINGDNPFQRLVNQMGLKKQFDENDMVADTIEAVTATTYAGVDFGLRSGTPPLSSTNPVDFLTTTVTTFEALSQPVDLFVSRGFMYWEYIYNDIIRGGALAGNPLPGQGNVNEQVGPFPGLDGVTWARDNAITSTTAGWAMNRNAIKNFRGPSRNYTIADEDTETTKYVTKNYFKSQVMDSTVIYKVTGIAA